MKGFHFDVEGKFTHATDLMPDPVVLGRYLVPNRCVKFKPPEPKDGFWPYWTGARWELRELPKPSKVEDRKSEQVDVGDPTRKFDVLRDIAAGLRADVQSEVIRLVGELRAEIAPVIRETALDVVNLRREVGEMRVRIELELEAMEGLHEHHAEEIEGVDSKRVELFERLSKLEAEVSKCQALANEMKVMIDKMRPMEPIKVVESEGNSVLMSGLVSTKPWWKVWG